MYNDVIEKLSAIYAQSRYEELGDKYKNDLEHGLDVLFHAYSDAYHYYKEHENQIADNLNAK